MPGVVDVHRMDQQKVRLMTQAQAFGVVEQMAVGIAVVVIEMPVLDRQLRRVGMAVARGVERRAVIQFAEPVVSGGGGGQPGGARVMKHALLMRKARDVVVHHAALHRRDAGEDAFIQRPGERGQLALQQVQPSASRRAFGLQIAHGVVRHPVVEAVQQHEDRFHGALTHCCINIMTFSCHRRGSALALCSRPPDRRSGARSCTARPAAAWP